MSTVEALLPSFRRYLVSTDKRPTTIAVYLAALTTFSTFLGDKDVSAITRADIEDYLNHRRSKVSGTTVHADWRRLRQFILWSIDEEELADNPMRRIPPPKRDTKLPDVYTESDYQRMLEACKRSESKFLQTRDTVLVAMLWETGLRRAELISIKVENLDLDNCTVRVYVTKSGKARSVAFSTKTGILIDRYIRQRAQQRYAKLPYLFIGIKGVFTGNGLYQVMREIEKRAGFNRVIRPHIMRHSWANEMLKAGLSPLDLATLAGWTDTSMLLTYGAAMKQERAIDSVRRLLDK